MSINIPVKNNYSMLLGSLGSGSGVSNLNFLSDHASIKSGSYYKLMKAYYGEQKTGKEISSLVKKNGAADDSKTLLMVEKNADALKSSADVFLAKGDKSLFKEVDITVKDENGVEQTTKGYDKKAIASALSQFVKDYNEMLDSTEDVNSTAITNRTSNLMNLTSANKNLLHRIGISIASDNTLSFDKDSFEKADINTVKTLFQGNGSYAYQVSAQSSLINYAAEKEASRAKTYNAGGMYTKNLSSGNIFDGFF